MRLSRSYSEKETCTKETFLVKIPFCTILIFSLVKHFFNFIFELTDFKATLQFIKSPLIYVRDVQRTAELPGFSPLH